MSKYLFKLYFQRALACNIDYCKETANSSRHVFIFFDEGNLYRGLLHIVDRIFESVIIFKFPVTFLI